MRVLLALVFFLAFPAHALTTADVFSQECTGSTVNRQLICGANITTISYSIVNQQVTLSSDTALSASTPLVVIFVPTGDPVPVRSDFYALGLQQVTSPTSTVSTPDGVAGRLYAVQFKDFAIGEVASTAEFTYSATPTTGTKFNPGHYYAGPYDAKTYIDNPALLANVLVSTGVCVPGSQVKGILVRFKSWGLFEPTVGNRVGFTLYDWILNHFASGDCRGTVDPPRLGGGFLWSSFGPDSYANRNVTAGVPGCVPSDNPAWGLAWIKPTSNNARCIARLWDQPAAVTALNNTITAMGQRYNDHPLFEWVNLKGEGSLSISQSGDAAYLADQEGNNALIRAEVRNQATVWRAAAPNTAFTIGANFFNTTTQADIETRRNTLIAFLDANPGLGSQWPDSFADANGAAKPRTDWHAALPSFVVSATSPRQARFMAVGETQRNTTTCNTSPQGCYDWMSEPGFFYTNNYDPNDMAPPIGPTDYSGAAVSHSVWLINQAAPFDRASIETMLDAESWEAWQEACPSVWGTCVTGGT